MKPLNNNLTLNKTMRNLTGCIRDIIREALLKQFTGEIQNSDLQDYIR